MPAFNFLPDELFHKIMFELNYKDILNLSRTHLRGRTLYYNSAFWFTKIDSIARGRSNSLSNKSFTVIVQLYQNMEKSGQIHIFGKHSKHDNRVMFPSVSVVQISCGYTHVAFLTNQGDLYTWGNNKSGQLGQGDHNTRTVPTKVGLNSRVKSVSSGPYHSALITDEGHLYVWGSNFQGNLGLANEKDRYILIPTRISNFTDVIQVACGGSHTVS